MRQQREQLRVAVVVFQHHRRAETAQDGGHRLGVQVDKTQSLGGLGQHHRARIGARCGFAFELQRQGLAIGCDQAQADRNHERLLARLARGEKPKYDGRCRELNLPAGPDTAVRFKTHHTGVTHWDDQIKGPIAFENLELDDLVLQRADGIPTYNFAVVVDDITMAVTHVIRGEDHIPNTPRQLLIYEALGIAPPLFAHMPFLFVL